MMVQGIAREAGRRRLQQDLCSGLLKRFAIRVTTAAGERIVKIAEVNTLGGRLLGLCGVSRGRREHELHRRALALEVAAVRTLGFLELRRGPLLIRSCQVQEPLSDDTVPLAVLLTRELLAHGPVAAESLGRALALTHRLPFFHSDLKPFHTFADHIHSDSGGPAQYRLRFIDLDHVAFWMSRRKRIISLYQTLRYILPDDPETQARFVTAYCAASGWYDNAPERGLAIVRRFLEHKLRTHPYP